MTRFSHPVVPAVLTALLALAAGASWADGDMPRVPVLPSYQAECSACHVAFPPGALPAASWQRLMQNLPRHFGTDASLDPAQVKEIADWLTANAGRSRSGTTPPEDRITRSAWWLHEHDEVSRAVWLRPAVGKASNCAACHTRANEGSYREREIRIPR